MPKRRLSDDEIAEREGDPSALTRRTFRHPWRVGAASGVVIALWMLVLDLPVALAVSIGLLMLVFTGFVWRPGGPGQRVRRYMLRRFPRK